MHKFNRATEDDVRIFMAVYRVVDKSIDLVLTMNVPSRGSDSTADEQQLVEAKTVFDIAARSLSIVDYGLFA